MLAGRGFATAATLILIALASLTVSRRLDRERRLIRKLKALDAGGKSFIDTDGLSRDEQDTAETLVAAGVLRANGASMQLDTLALARFQGRRFRLAVGGALAALLLAFGLGAIILAR